LKVKPFIEVSLKVVDVEEGTGRNAGKLGALVVEGTDMDKFIKTNVGSGLTDEDRETFWQAKDKLIGQIVEVRADAITQNQETTDEWSLRFPRFLRFRGFEKGRNYNDEQDKLGYQPEHIGSVDIPSGICEDNPGQGVPGSQHNDTDENGV
jgi:ATP-dependent DNA ligase